MPGTRRSIAAIAVLSLTLVLSACGGAQARRAAHMERGQEYFAAGNYEKARVEFRNALQITPDDTEARFMSGRVAEKLGDLRGAAGMYQATIDKDGGHVQARANLGRMFVFAGATAKALETIEPVMAKHPDDPDLLTVRGAARIQQNDKAGALADAEHAVKVAPDNESAVALLASLYRQSGEVDRAIELITKAVERKPDALELREVLANLYLPTQPDLAIEQIRKVIAAKPQQLAYRVQLALLYTREKKTDEAEKVLREAIDALPKNNDAKLAYVEYVTRQGSPQRGEEALKQFIARDPKNYDLQLGLGAIQQRANATQAAVATYQQVITGDADGPAGLTARNRIAAIEVSRGNFDAALQLVEAILKKNPRDNDALVLRGNIALERNDPAAAIADLRAVLRDQPGAVVVLRTLARAHIANGEPALAEEAIRSAMDAAPADTGVRVELAQLLLQTNRGPQAIALLEETVRSSPANIPAREALVRAYIAAKDFDAARRGAEDLKVAAPKLATGSYLAGIVAQAQNRADDAATEYTHALELQPDAVDALAALTRLDVARNQSGRALARIQSLVDAQPSNAVVRNMLGEMQMAAKSYDAATTTLTAATKAAPSWWIPYRNLALTNLARGNVDGAIATYQAGITATGRNALLVGELAALYESKGRVEDAIKEYQG
jgi:tetratricopeptide (TPR) repeat protein